MIAGANTTNMNLMSRRNNLKLSHVGFCTYILILNKRMLHPSYLCIYLFELLNNLPHDIQHTVNQLTSLNVKLRLIILT